MRREAHRLDAIAPRAAYQLDEAVDFVCDRLPEESQARLTPEEVEQLLVFHLQWLHSQGLQPDRAVDQVQNIDETVVVTEDALTAYLLGESRFGVLGHYPEGQFEADRVSGALQSFQGRLKQVEDTINNRNETRPAYIHLKPSRIAPSINI